MVNKRRWPFARATFKSFVIFIVFLFPDTVEKISGDGEKADKGRISAVSAYVLHLHVKKPAVIVEEDCPFCTVNKGTPFV